MSIEKDYYENPDFWADDIFAGDSERFRGVLDLIPDDARTLLDVGCGNGAFLHFVLDSGRTFDRLHGADRSQTALSRVRTDKTLASIENLAFRDRAFDAVTCLEVIEHLPHGIYEQGLANLCRIAGKYVVIGVPFDEDIEADLVRCPSCTGRFNPDYHLRRYSEDSLNDLLLPYGFQSAGRLLFGAMARYLFVTGWLQRRNRARRNGNPFHTAIPCPMCGFSLPPRIDSSAIASPAPSAAPAAREVLGVLAKKILRTGPSYGGIAMVYRRSA
ncbi:hypothetical protein DMC47_26425 [Nostoc sp. 3335mG]|nr:hypothetical protein DMC47_26425 [Nostoc sp. 3335mG]